MITSTFKSLLVTLALMLVTSNSYAQGYISTRIDVSGSRYGDQMWVFAISNCTRGYDNGWDGYKMLGSSVAPQIMAIEESGYYQVDAVPDLNNTVIGFKAGEDSQYTFTFSNENLILKYENLYLYDMVTNDTIDITATGTKYTFNVEPTDVPVARFILIATLPVVVAPIPEEPVVVPEEPVVEDTVVTVPVDTVIIEVPVEEPIDTVIVEEPEEVEDPANNHGKNKNGKKDKKIKISNSKRMIAIENQSNCRGKVKVINAMTGRKVKEAQFNSNGITNIETDVPAGTYIIEATTETEETSTTIIFY